TIPISTQTTGALISFTATQTLTMQVQIDEDPISDDTVIPTSTATITLTPLPEVVWAEVQSPEGNGANIREEPGYSERIVRTVLNGTAIQVLDEVEVVNGATWVRIRFIDGVEGWIMRNLIISATPEPQW
ncbi:MAG TPA: SH3 domain-containing protein, partial [Anaerolineaceae bacterium]|nr:SH3 domain-containing protein [Anaerolineaceae bacterium]